MLLHHPFLFNNNKQIKSNEEEVVDNNFSIPGSGYMKMRQYYQEEKEHNVRKENSLKIWEKFISKFFAKNIDMEIKIFEKDEVAYTITGSYETLPYVYFHKNRSLYNLWMFIDNYLEIIKNEIETKREVKVVYIKDALNVIQYKQNKVFIYFDAEVRFNSALEMEYVRCYIHNIEIHDEVKGTNINVMEFKKSIMNLYKNFKNFMSVSL